MGNIACKCNVLWRASSYGPSTHYSASVKSVADDVNHLKYLLSTDCRGQLSKIVQGTSASITGDDSLDSGENCNTTRTSGRCQTLYINIGEVRRQNNIDGS
jgi:hypothetical protein